MTLTGADLFVLLLYDLPMAALSIIFPICVLFLISWLSDKYRWFRTLWFVLFGLYSAWMTSYVFSGLRENGTGILRSIFGSVLIFVGLYSVSWFLHKLAMCVVGKIREFLRDKKEQRKKSEAGDMGSVSFWVLLVLGLAAIVGLCYFIMQGSDTKTNLPVIRSDVAIVTPTSTPRPTATPRRTSVPAPMRTSSAASPLSFYYQMNYPMTWGYISKYSSAPESYLQTYDRIWGDLQRYHGDGIPFDTLSRYEQSLVNYPGIGSYIYFANASSREYHSTVYCYTLLRSNPVQRSSRYASQYNPCSKCVGD